MMGIYTDISGDTVFNTLLELIQHKGEFQMTDNDDIKWRKEVLPLELLLLIAKTNQYCDYDVIILTGSTPYDLEITIDDAFLTGEEPRTYYYRTITIEQFATIIARINSIVLDVKSSVIKDKFFKLLNELTSDELDLLKDVDVSTLIKDRINRFTE